MLNKDAIQKLAAVKYRRQIRLLTWSCSFLAALIFTIVFSGFLHLEGWYKVLAFLVALVVFVWPAFLIFKEASHWRREYLSSEMERWNQEAKRREGESIIAARNLGLLYEKVQERWSAQLQSLSTVKLSDVNWAPENLAENVRTFSMCLGRVDNQLHKIINDCGPKNQQCYDAMFLCEIGVQIETQGSIMKDKFFSCLQAKQFFAPTLATSIMLEYREILKKIPGRAVEMLQKELLDHAHRAKEKAAEYQQLLEAEQPKEQV
ncbi:MAG TPA: hypothetical protein PKI61_00595 [bacterium]|nr:hypothetical protein [bacterium]HPT29386.1 hypothetical protein [bacterium]